MGPPLDGLSVLKALRQVKVTAPAIFLTALGEIEDRVEGLRSGGDDYLAKPFVFSELLARVEDLARRQGAAEEQSPELTVGDITIDLHKRTCARQNQHIDLNPKEFLLLEVFLRSKTRAYRREQCFSNVFGE